MDILTLVRVFFKRWYITVPVVVATLAVAAHVQSNVPSQYQANGTLLMERPEFDPSRLPMSLVSVEEIVTSIDPDVRADLDEDEEFQLRARDARSMDVISISEDPALATERASSAIDRIEQAVAEPQDVADVPADERVVVKAAGIATEELEDGRYQISTRVELDDPTERVANPYGPGGTTSQLLEIAVSSDQGRRAVLAMTGPGVGYTVATSTRDGAIMNITTIGSNPDQIIEAFEPIRQVMADELDARQERAQVPEVRRVQLEVLAAPTTVTDVSAPLDRSVAAIVGVGGLVALVLAIVTESFASRRRMRHRDPAPAPSRSGGRPDTARRGRRRESSAVASSPPGDHGGVQREISDPYSVGFRDH